MGIPLFIAAALAATNGALLAGYVRLQRRHRALRHTLSRVRDERDAERWAKLGHG